MMRRPDDADPLAAAERFRRRRAEVAEGLTALLGRRAAVAPLDAESAVAAVESELIASHHEAEPHEWAMVRREWSADDVGGCADTLHRLARHLGARPAWLVVAGCAVQVAAVTAEMALDNPFGFAALAEPYGPDLRLLDQDVAAGLWLVRRSHHMGTVDVHGWALDVWGEPWLSAATRALRGVG